MVISVTQSAEATDSRSRQALFERLMEQTSRQAYALAYRLTGNAAEAEDLVQDAYIRAFRFFNKYDPALSFNSWLYRIMANTHIDTVRRKGRFKLTSIDQSGANGATTWDFPDPEPTAERALLDGAVGDQIQDALNAMTPEFRTAVVLADVEGMAYEEIADAMSTSVGTVRSRIHRGRKQIRRHLLIHAPGEFGRLSNEVH